MSGYYQVNKLHKRISKDENWLSGKIGTTEEFKDFEERIILRRLWETETKSLSTYYVYDDFGNLRYVLPPAVNENGKSTISSFTENDAVFDQFIYAYHYDGRQRVVEKKIPGKGWEFILYNKLDQVVATQDAMQRSKAPQEYTFTKYDALGRVVLTGICRPPGSVANISQRVVFQSVLDRETVLWEQRVDSGNGYSGLSAPNSSFITTILTINYYDDYNFYDNRFGGPVGAGQVTGQRTKTLLTGTRVNVLGTSTMLLTVHYYDEKGRVLESKMENHLDGTDVLSNTWSFSGDLTASKRVHTVGSTVTTIANSYGYDHVGRKIITKESINGQPEVILSKLEYNEVGQLLNKKLHSIDNGTSFLQSTNYAYNERGWLKNSNSAQFSQQLNYQDGTIPQFNGNISTQLWGTGLSLAKTFTYSYDPLNRLRNAVSAGLGEEITYDEMGNIQRLTREGYGTNNYTGYSGNKLTQISGFTNSNYSYDANGNLINDSQKDISLSYNYMNLPQQISGSQTITYIYDAAGNKLKKQSTTGVTDYVNGIQYKAAGLIDVIQTEVGLARNNNGFYSYEYTLSDHLGNTRVTFYQNPNTSQLEVLQRDDYYAFGLRKSALVSANENKYLYNNKELQEELGQYDYGARFYDPVIGRWNVIDPKAESYDRFSPYNYTLNNPINFIDPDGTSVEDGPHYLASTFVGNDGKIIKHINDSDKNIYLVSDQRNWDGSKNGLQAIGEEKSDRTYKPGGYLLGDELKKDVVLPIGFGLSLGDKRGTKMEMPIYIGVKGLLNGLPKLLQNLGGAIEGIENLSAMLVSMKGERNQAGSAGGTNNPFKKLKPDPNKPGNVLEKNSHTGKTTSKPAPEGFWPWWNSKK